VSVEKQQSGGGTRAGVLCAGCVLVDVNKRLDRFPPPEQVAIIEEETHDSGGPGFNLVVDLYKLGAPFPLELVGVIGDDAHGKLVLDICRGAGIDARAVRVAAGAVTSYTDVMIEPGGRRTFFHQKGANALLAPEQFDFSATRARIFHFGSPGLHDVMDRPRPGGNGVSEVLARAQAAGLRTNLELVSLSPERLRALAGPCLRHLDYVIVNELEAGALTRIDVDMPPGLDDGADRRGAWRRAEAAARALLDLGVSRLAVVHFPAGCVAAGKDGALHRQGSVRVPPADVRSTNGAGDAFAAGVMLGLHEGWPVERCLRLGVCVAAVSLGAYSTSGAIRPAAECQAYGERAGFRQS
jgi:sugar/nucleoside kinase (ribokinase family)